MENMEEKQVEYPYLPCLFTIQLTFLPYSPYHFTIQLVFLPYCPYLITIRLAFLPYADRENGEEK
jgi:hypothetical protein